MEAVAVTQGVIGNIQYVIGFMIRKMNLEQMEALVDEVDQPDLLGKQVKGADAAEADAVNAFGDFVMNVGGSENGPIATHRLGFIEPPLNSALASAEAVS